MCTTLSCLAAGLCAWWPIEPQAACLGDFLPWARSKALGAGCSLPRLRRRWLHGCNSCTGRRICSVGCRQRRAVPVGAGGVGPADVGKLEVGVAGLVDLAGDGLQQSAGILLECRLAAVQVREVRVLQAQAEGVPVRAASRCWIKVLRRCPIFSMACSSCR